MSKISVCVLCYGDYPELAKRCLDSIAGYSDGHELVADFRIALHDTCERTTQYVYDWVEAMWRHGHPCIVYQPRGNILKYPTMRRMFFDDSAPLAEYTMWFDDDSYLDGNRTFWQDAVTTMESNDMIGQHWWKGFIGGMYPWILTQPWSAGLPPRKNNRALFCTGGWWTIRSEVLRKYDWPAKEIRHKGGDMVLGELCRHQNLRMGVFDNGVRINADGDGMHSRAARRGVSANAGPEREVGWNFSGEPLDTSHQEFEVTRAYYWPF